MKNKKIKTFLLLGLLVLGLTACSSKKEELLSKKDLNKEFVQTTKILDSARGQVGEQVSKKSTTKKIKVSNEKRKILKENLTNLNHADEKLDYSVRSAAKYPKALRDYNNQVKSYINGLLKGESKEKAVEQFHKTTKTAYALQFQYANEENKYLDIAIASDQASGKKVDQNLSIQEASKNKTKKKNSKSKSTKTKDAATKKLEKKLGMKVKQTKVAKKKPPVNIPLTWVAWFTVLAVLLITSVFLQPNKSNDSMSALTNSGGAELYNRPKPIGYQLFLQRLTEGTIAILVISLIIFNTRGI